MYGATKVALEIGATGGAGLLRSGAGFRQIQLVDGYYQAEGLPLKFSQYYYERLWATGRGAPFLQAQEVLATGRVVGPDRMPGFYRYTNDFLDMVYNPTTGEVWHIQPIR
jgi:filamentous hemagglutinin